MDVTEHPAHRRLTERQTERPHRTGDEHVGFNGRLGAWITSRVGTMWAFYFAALFMGGWMLLSAVHVIAFDPYPYAFLLFLGNIVQLLLMFVIMVGQQVLGRAADKRAAQTYKDAEAILHECVALQHHLRSQDALLSGLLERVERISGTPPREGATAT